MNKDESPATSSKKEEKPDDFFSADPADPKPISVDDAVAI